MKETFDKRRLGFYQNLLKYLPYVLNDHFVLVLMVGLGFVLYQYRQVLQNLPQPSLLYLGLGLYWLFLLSLGQVGTYLEEADSQFLLPKEEEVASHIQQSKRRASLFWNGLTSLFWLFSLPLFLALGGLVYFLWGYLLLHIGKWLVISWKSSGFIRQGRVEWQEVIVKEQNRQQGILKFFALFTNVKGLKQSRKPRTYLDGLLRHLPKGQRYFYLNLYARAFLRTGDYLGIYLRLTLLMLVLVASLRTSYLAAGVGVVGQFLWQFQLLSLYHHYDYQYLLTLTPLDQGLKTDGLLFLLRILSLPGLFFSLLLIGSWQAGLLLVVGALVLNFIYLPQKIRAMID